jgi:hypothetical protein
MPLIILCLILQFAHADALLDAIYSSIYSPIYTTYAPPTQNAYQNNPSDEYESFDAYGDQTEHYSWDNLYLCQFCDTEIIIDPYGPSEAEYNDY